MDADESDMDVDWESSLRPRADDRLSERLCWCVRSRWVDMGFTNTRQKTVAHQYLPSASICRGSKRRQIEDSSRAKTGHELQQRPQPTAIAWLVNAAAMAPRSVSTERFKSDSRTVQSPETFSAPTPVARVAWHRRSWRQVIISIAHIVILSSDCRRHWSYWTFCFLRRAHVPVVLTLIPRRVFEWAWFIIYKIEYAYEFAFNRAECLTTGIWKSTVIYSIQYILVQYSYVSRHIRMYCTVLYFTYCTGTHTVLYWILVYTVCSNLIIISLQKTTETNWHYRGRYKYYE